MDSLSVDIVEVENKVKKIIMHNENIIEDIRDISNSFSALENYYKSSNSKSIEINNINLRQKLRKSLGDRQITIKEIKNKLESYKLTEKEVQNIFNRGSI